MPWGTWVRGRGAKGAHAEAGADTRSHHSRPNMAIILVRYFFLRMESVEGNLSKMGFVNSIGIFFAVPLLIRRSLSLLVINVKFVECV